MASLGKMTVTIDRWSQDTIDRLVRLKQFTEELREDFSYREDVIQANADIDWLLSHAKLERQKRD